MSILIKGMDIPQKGEYNATLYVCDDGSAYLDVAAFPVDEDRFDAIPASNVVEARPIENEIVKFGKIPFVLFKCKSCGNKGWWGTLRPKFCVNCGGKFIYGGVDDAAN